MAHNSINRRKLASSDHNLKTSISMDSTFKKQPKSYPQQDSYVPSNNTIEKISNQFSQLYANHKILKSNLKDSCGHSYSCDDNIVKLKSWSDSAGFDSSCTALTKSKSQHSSSSVKDIVVQKSDEEIKKVSSFKGKEFVNLSKSQEIEKGVVKKQSLLSLPTVNNNGGRKSSFSSSKIIELADFFSCNGVKVVAVDMPPSMQIHAVNCARKTHDSLEKFTSKTLALTLKKEFDGVYGPAWHCIVGTSFGSFVTHSVGGFIYFSMDHKLYVLLFKTAVQKAESS